MPRGGFIGLAIADDSIDAMARTHELHEEIGAPDLAPDFLYFAAESGKHFPAWHSADYARALGEGVRRQARLSLSRRPVDGYCQHGHELTPENRIGRHCRQCKNAWKRAARSPSIRKIA